MLRIVATGHGRKKATDPMNRWYWQNLESQDKRVQQETIAPVITRLDALLTPPVRSVLCQRPRLDLRATLDEGRILVCNLDKGKLGEMNSHLLGAFIVSGVVQAAMTRSSQFHQRHFLYVDEFQNFATESFATALSEARKKGLGITIAHQFIKQVPEQLMSAVLGNCGTSVVFRVGAEDAPLLAAHVGGWVGNDDVRPQVLKELPNYEAIIRVLEGGAPSTVRVKTVPPPLPLHDRTAQLIRNSRTRFGRPARLVEAAIAQNLVPPRRKRERKWN